MNLNILQKSPDKPLGHTGRLSLRIKTVAILLSTVTVVLGHLILKGDPSSEGNLRNPRAVQQVKTFADFIQSQPDVMNRLSVLDKNKTGDSPEYDLDPKIETDFYQHLNRLDDPETAAKAEQFLKEHPRAVFSFLKNKMNTELKIGNDDWVLTGNGLALMAKHQHADAMMLLRDLILAASNDASNPDAATAEAAPSMKALVNSWAALYKNIENRPEKLKEFSEVYTPARFPASTEDLNEASTTEAGVNELAQP
jgi:hypothetical protein